MLPSMSVLTFEILSVELTQSLAERSNIPPETTARCTLGRDKVMVLVEYPLDSAKAEPMASQTLDWLEQALRHQFDTTGLPEEAADLAGIDSEVSVQLFLKHFSESKPFTMRSFIWKVDDGFDDLFGESLAAVQTDSVESYQAGLERAEGLERASSLKTAETVGIVAPAGSSRRESRYETPIFHRADEHTRVADVGAADLTADLIEPPAPYFSDEELVPSELYDEHLQLDLEPDLDLGIDLSQSLGLEGGIGLGDELDLYHEVYGETSFDADLAMGMPADERFVEPASDFNLPGEPLELDSDDFNLPTLDMPGSKVPDIYADDFFNLDEAEVRPLSLVESFDLDLELEMDIDSEMTADEGSTLRYGLERFALGEAELEGAELEGAELEGAELEAYETFSMPSAEAALALDALLAEEPVESERVEPELEFNLVESELVESELVESEPVESEPVEFESVESEPVELETFGAGLEFEPVDSESMEADLFELEPFEADLFEPDIQGEDYSAEDYSAQDYTAEDYSADDYTAEDYSAEDYAAEDYAADDDEEEDYAEDDDDEEVYEDDPAYYLEGEAVEDIPYEDVALVDDTEVQRQREQWQQQSKPNPWVFAGALGFALVGVLGFGLTRPCTFGQCDRLQTAQAASEESISKLRIDSSSQAVTASKQQLKRSIGLLTPIPIWSSHYGQAQAALPGYEAQLQALDWVSESQTVAYEAAVASQNPPHPASKWQTIAASWLKAAELLDRVPTDSPVRELVNSKLVEYRANRATILVRIDAESKAELSLRQAQQAASLGTKQIESANSVDTWEQAMASWSLAVNKLSQIPNGTFAHGEAQKLLPEYLKKLDEVRDRATQEIGATRLLDQVKQIATAAQKAETEEQWTVSLQKWKTALSQLQTIPPKTLAHVEAQSMQGLYATALNKAENNLQVALRFQPIEPNFFTACAVTGTQKCTYSIKSGSVRLNLAQGYDTVINNSITPPDQRSSSDSPASALVAQANQLLQEITLLSTQAKVPVELYDAKGQFLALYRPDLSGFTRQTQQAAVPVQQANAAQ
jgi:hypothetical protein